MVVTRRGLSPRQWANRARNLTGKDLDDVILLVGPEGVGKSTVAIQLGKLLWPDLPLENVRFGVTDFLSKAREASPEEVIIADEILINKRKGMWGDTIELIDFLQVCRGMNLHLILCFPHEDLIDKQVLDYRIRYKVDVVKRGLVKVYEKFTWYSPVGEKMSGWRLIATWNVKENTGDFWATYLAKKSAHMSNREEIGPQIDSWDIEALRIWGHENKVTPIPEF